MITAGAVSGTLPSPAQAVPLLPSAPPPAQGISFGDILDTLNPLQHIPVLSGLYRAATGSEISAGAKIAGDTLYGALLPGGAVAALATSVADVAVKQVTGSDVSRHVVDTLISSAQTATPLHAANPTGNMVGTHAEPATFVALPPIGGNIKTSNGQYQRAQAFDALNSKLLKMAV